MPRFRDRASAGDVLARSLARVAGGADLVILGVARGGVPVARSVAEALGATLGVVVARRLVVPGVEDVALGAIAEGSRRIAINVAAQHFGVPARILEQIAGRERVELERCAALYHAGWPRPDLRGRVVVIVDDGLVTGSTLRAVARVARRARPARLIAAVPVASAWGLQLVAREVDDIAVAFAPPSLEAIAEAYEDVALVSDDEVLEALGRQRRSASAFGRDARARLAMSSPMDDRSRHREQTILIPVAGGMVRTQFGMPRRLLEPALQRRNHVRGLVIVAHSEGTRLQGIAARYLTGRLRLEGYATVRLTLTTTSESRDGGGVGSALDVPVLASRVIDVCDWVAREGIIGGHRTILLGAGVGAPVALVAAARRPEQVRGVIVCGGHADFVTRSLSEVRTPVLVIVDAGDRAASRHASVWSSWGRAEVVTAPQAAHAMDDPNSAGFFAERAVEWLERLDRWDPTKASRDSR